MTDIARGLRTANPEPLFSEHFDRNVRWRSERRAIVFEESVLTWKELGERAYQVANGLANLGLGRGDAVVVLLDNRLETAEIAIGIIRSGACIVPINLHISDEAISRQIADSGAVAVFATPQDAVRVSKASGAFGQARRIVVGAPLEGWTDYAKWREIQSAQEPKASSLPDDLLTIVYSSGTTGVPKGIAHTHLTRLRNMRALGLAFRIHEDTVWITSLGFYSNAAMLPVLMTLLVGGCVVILPKFDPVTFFRAIELHRGTHFLWVPVMLRAMLAHPEFERWDVSCVEVIVVGGAAVEPEFKESGCRRFGCILLELYGLTEGFVTITSHSDGASKIGSVGRPLPGSDLKILRADGSEASIGEPGEIVGLTDAVMAGYLNRPQETAAAFVEDEQGRRWLRTGDLGKLDHDGFLYYVGRSKDLIVSGGQNIYPIDIEEVGKMHPAVDQIAVVGVPHPKWDETPVAVIVQKDGENCDADELQAWINERVGKRQRVCAVIFEASLPVNALGKVLKNELRTKLMAEYPALRFSEAQQ